MDKSTLLNVHMVQPIMSIDKSSAPFLLSTYGTNSKYTSLDIIRRWIWIFDQCREKDIRILGFSTDGDAKYLRAMKLVLGFFASLPNMALNDRTDAFEISIPASWTWFYLRHRQLVLCFKILHIFVPNCEIVYYLLLLLWELVNIAFHSIFYHK